MTRPTRTVTRNRYELPSIGGDLAWQEQAACAGTDLGLWFITERADAYPGERRARERRAKGYCAICEVRDDCLAWAYDVGDVHAILGGLTPDERKRARRNERRKVAAR